MNRTEAARERLEILHAWRRLFFDDRNELKPEAVVVMRDLERAGHQTRTTSAVDSGGRIDPLRMALNEGKRMAFLHVRARLYEPLEPVMRAAEESE